MCGPSADENALKNQNMLFSSILQSNYNTLFGDQLNTLNAINRSLSPILAAGPNQHGFSGDELSAFQTQAVNNAGAAAASAEQAARTFGAGQGGGGTSGLMSGVTKQILSSIASTSAGQLGSELNQITRADYARGAENYWRAAGGMQALAGEYSPNAAAQGAISETGQAFSEAQEVNKESQWASQMAGGILGAGLGIGSSFLTGGLSNLGPGSGFGDFLQGGLSGLTGGA